MVVVEDGLCDSVPKFICFGHGVALPDGIEVLIGLFWFEGEKTEGLVVSDIFEIVAVIEGKNVQLSILDSSAGLCKQCLCFDEVCQCKCRLLVDEMNDR